MPDRTRRLRFSWRLASLPVRMAVLAAAAAALGLGAVLVLTANTRIDATSASVLVAVVAGSATVLQQRTVQRRTHTITLITALQNGRLAQADDWMALRIATGRPVGPDLTAAEQPLAMGLLDYYEFLAVLAQRGLIDVPLLLDLRGGAMTRCYRLCHGYVADRRRTVSPGLYSSLEAFATAYARRLPPDIAATLPEPRTATDPPLRPPAPG